MIHKIDKLMTAMSKYNNRRDELNREPSTVDIFKDERLLFCSSVVEKYLKEITFIDNKKKKKKS